jgi:hypothetical protein
MDKTGIDRPDLVSYSFYIGKNSGQNLQFRGQQDVHVLLPFCFLGFKKAYRNVLSL